MILAANREIQRECVFFKDDREQCEASLTTNPLSAEQTFSRFGLLLGLFPPAVIFYQLLKNNSEPEIIALFVFVNLVCTAAGYFSGKLVGKMVLAAENYSWHKMLLRLPLIGMFWGLITGGIGGIFIFVVGAFVGGIIAAAVGAVAVTVLTIFHRLLKRGEMIERKHFYPLAFGVTLAIAALILGL